MWPILSSVVLHNIHRGAVRILILGVMALIWSNIDPLTSDHDLKLGDLFPTQLALFGSLVVAMFVTLQELPMEMNSRFHLILLSKPISRTDYLLGKIIGIFALGGIVVTITTIFAFIAMTIQCKSEVPLMSNLLLPLFHYLLFIWVFAVAAGVAGAFLSEALCIMLTCFVFAATIAVSLIPIFLEDNLPWGAGWLLKLIYYLVPNSYYFSPGKFSEYTMTTPFLVTLYALGYTGVVLPTAIRNFNRISFH